MLFSPFFPFIFCEDFSSMKSIFDFGVLCFLLVLFELFLFLSFLFQFKKNPAKLFLTLLFLVFTDRLVPLCKKCLFYFFEFKCGGLFKFIYLTTSYFALWSVYKGIFFVRSIIWNISFTHVLTKTQTQFLVAVVGIWQAVGRNYNETRQNFRIESTISECLIFCINAEPMILDASVSVNSYQDLLIWPFTTTTFDIK